MKPSEVDEIIACLPKGRTLFYYFQDRYALLLLSYLVGAGRSKADVRRTSFSKLLSKPIVQAATDNLGHSILSTDVLNSVWPPAYECYLLTLGSWGSGNRTYDQMSRTGHNLVLQLNFSSKHDRPYQALIGDEADQPFEYAYHPIAEGGYHTLAWARLDIDLRTGEALIEEVQNDWLRFALSSKSRAEPLADEESVYFRGSYIAAKRVRRYVRDVLAPHLKIWDEAMLMAAIWFLTEELGIQRIFYHTHASGTALKQIVGRPPPRSLYTSLPKKFCFVATEERPTFLYRTASKNRQYRDALKQAQFQLLEW